MTRSILSNNLTDKLSGSFVVVDTTALIDASKNNDFLTFLWGLSSVCSFITIPAVIYEFSKYAKDKTQLSAFNTIIDGLEVTVMNNIEESALKDSGLVFTRACYMEIIGNNDNRKKGPSYTDSLLCYLTYKYRDRDIYLLTQNYNDIPSSLFVRDEFVSYMTERDVRSHIFYKLRNESVLSRIVNKYSY